MRCPTLKDLPSPLKGKTRWPWTEENERLPDKMPDDRPWPRVSIVTPSYNQGQFIEETIRSVLLQGYPNLEYIIIDGGSTDGTVDIIRKYEKWLAYWVSEPDRGQSHAINKGLKISTGKLFNWQNADDVLAPGALRVTASAMIDYPQASYVHGYQILIDSQSNIIHELKPPYGGKCDFLPSLVHSISNFKGGSHLGCLMDRNLVVEVGMIDESLHYTMDVDITLRLQIIRPAFYVDRLVLYFRIRPDMKTNLWNAQRAKERLIIAHKIFSCRNLPLQIKKLKRKAFAIAHRFAWENYAKARMYPSALVHLIQDIFYSPIDNGSRRKTVFREVILHIKWFGFIYRCYARAHYFISRSLSLAKR